MNDGEKITIWLDAEGDRLTVTWGIRDGYYIKTDDPRVMARVDKSGKTIGFQVESLETLQDARLEVGVPGNWYDQLDKTRGSRPRCVLLMDGEREEVAARLTNLVNVPGVAVAPDDQWEPYGKPVWQEGKWDLTPTREAQLGKANNLVSGAINRQLLDWWLVHTRNSATPNWDIASACTVKGQPGLLLVEAKAHLTELSPKSDQCGSTNMANREQIQLAIAAANATLQSTTGNLWNLSRDHHYQLSNRFAWAWKLADLGVPVVLVYLGFLNAQDMIGVNTELFQSAEHWAQSVKEYGKGVIDNSCWGQWLDIGGTPLLPLIRAYDQPFYP